MAGLVLLALGGSLQPSAARAAAANWAIQPPAQGSLSPTSSLSLSIPADLPAAQLASLAVEIDQIDITAIARIGSGSIVYAPPQPLTPGTHELRVVEYAGGRLIPRGHWSFTVKPPGQGGPARGWSVRGSVNAMASERIAESNLTPPTPPAFTANGTFDIKAVRTMSEWTAQASIEGLYGSDNGTSAVSGQGLQPAQIQGSLERNGTGRDCFISEDATPVSAVNGWAQRYGWVDPLSSLRRVTESRSTGHFFSSPAALLITPNTTRQDGEVTDTSSK